MSREGGRLHAVRLLSDGFCDSFDVIRVDDLERVMCEPCMQVEIGGDEGEEGAGQMRLPCPRSPTEQEREGHEVSHIPFRSWCEACVRVRGAEIIDLEELLGMTVPIACRKWGSTIG